ncbi:MAG: hypothetical protein AAF790_02975 [Planctomycetota bacterium]
MPLPNRQKHTERLRHARRRLRRLQQARQRRGVLLLVVLSMLTLFLLIGATFVVYTSSFRTTARVAERANQTSLQAGDRLDRALLQVLRDTNNPHSALRYHSLLRDVYGSDGFVGHVYAGDPERLNASGASTVPHTPRGGNPADIGDGFSGPPVTQSMAGNYSFWASRYASATNPANPLGPTRGQFIDIFVQDDLGLENAGSTLLATPAANLGLPAEYVVDLELDENGLTTNHRLSRTGGYYNGCLLTILEGPAKGQTARVVQYDYFVNDPENTSVRRNIARFRVMAFTRSDGTPLRLGLHPQAGDPNDLVYAVDRGNPIGVVNDNDPFYGVRVMVNGRPYGGSGVGFNPFAGIADPKLSTVEIAPVGNSGWVGVETALTPNARYFQPSLAASFSAAAGTPYVGLPGTVDTFYGNPLGAYTLLNTLGSPTQFYGGYPGAGGSNESYDAADYQNMFLALQPLTPRPEGRVFSPATGPLPLTDPAAAAVINGGVGARLDLDNVPVPSFHRPALVNYWLHRLYRAPWLAAVVNDPQARVRAILRPFDADGFPTEGMTPAVAGQILAIKRKISLRPLREDHPNFDGSNPSAVYANRPAPTDTGLRFVDQRGTTGAGQEADDQITFPFWEATGPWDVDNDNDGVPDSIWVDLGDPVQEAADGRLYKPLYAILIEDLDGRLNLNAHGSLDQLLTIDNDGSSSAAPVPAPEVKYGNAGLVLDNFNLPTGASTLLGLSGSRLLSTNQLPPGAGWGPADISPRPVLSPDYLPPAATPANTLLLLDNAPREDDYARLLLGRKYNVADAPFASVAADSPWGRYGSVSVVEQVALNQVVPVAAIGLPAPGLTFVAGAAVDTRDWIAQYKLFDYPERATTPSGFGTPPDLRSRYATGLSYTGAKVGEAVQDLFQPTLLTDSPYEADLMSAARRGQPQAYSQARPDDALFSPGELERLLRALDPDAGDLPNRLWDLVDAFDPNKLVVQQSGVNALAAGGGAPEYQPTTVELVQAQIEAAIRRRAVTTESVEIPAPGDDWSSRLVYGADGRPGRGGFDEEGPDTSNDAPDADTTWDGSLADADDLDNAGEFNLFADGSDVMPIDANGNGVIDAAEVASAVTAAFAQGIDDYVVIMGAAPPQNARLLDYLRYRVVLELKRRDVGLPSGTPIRSVFPDANRSQVAGGFYGFTIADMDALEARVNQVIYGNNQAFAEGTRHAPGVAASPTLASYGGLLAPEVISGLRMDVNRPFGDGRDNNGNGVVDEPLEAGEPWIDADGNGVWNNEPFLDLDNDGRFYADVNADGRLDVNDWVDATPDGVNNPLPVVDSLYAEQLGTPVPFDHTGGADANGRGAVFNVDSRVRVYDDGRMARQLYARHLYCLMLLLMDEDYLAPFDPKDPQVAFYLDPDSFLPGTGAPGAPPVRRSVAGQIKEDLMAADASLTDAEASARARRLAQRKLTCRRIAQWAINCVELRDADSICTPFEYDENPWDGWNVVDEAGGRVFPLDGDASTDENRMFTRRLSPADGWSAPERRFAHPGAAGGIIPDSVQVAAFHQTRGLVWGTERPELLLTEGLALHDRRVSDETAGGVIAGQGAPDANAPGAEQEPPEDDLDQFFRPKGTAFVEVYNPWSADGQLPAELYRDRFGRLRFAEMDRDSEGDGPPVDANLDGLADTDPLDDVPVQGVLLDRLSDGEASVSVLGADGRTQDVRAPSPVWRMICIEQHPEVRNDDPFDDATDRGISEYLSFERGLGNDRAPEAYRSVATEARATAETVLNTLGGNNVFGNRNDRALTRLRAALVNLRGEVPDPARIPDPDFPTFDRDATPVAQQAGGRFSFRKPLEYIEREWYFTREPSFDSSGAAIGGPVPFAPQSVALCIPDRPIRVNLGVGGVGGGVSLPDGNDERRELWPEGVARGRLPGGRTNGELLIYKRSFPPIEQIPNEELARTQGNGRFRTLPLAPILPGQYGVIGSTGFEYQQLPGMYVTRIGRSTEETAESARLGDTAVRGSRRIELIPNRNPFLHQVCVGRNFGDEFRVLAPVPVGGVNKYVVNVTNPSRMPSGPDDLATTIAGVGIRNMKDFNDSEQLPAFYTAPARARAGSGFSSHEIDPTNPDDMRLYSIRPVVAVPVDGMNISEPLDGYVLRRAELQEGFSLPWSPNEYAGEGTYGKQGETEEIGYDVPFDLAPELIVNHTTPNYRSVHLQRLANPLLAWNPPPLRVDGTPHPQHDAARPVNPYLTVDSMSLDVTAMNSINTDEEKINPEAAAEGDGGGENLPPRTDGLVRLLRQGGDPADLHKQAHYRPVLGDIRTPGAGGPSQQNDAGKIMMTLGTQFRGANEQSTAYGGTFAAPTLIDTLQPARLIFRQERPNQLIDILDNRIDTSSTLEARGSYVTPAGETAIDIAAEEVLAATGALHDLTMDYVLRHSLGYDNSAVVRQYFENPDFGAGGGATNREDRRYYRGKVDLVGSFSSALNTNAFDTQADNFCYRVDINGDGLLGDIVGVPRVNEANRFTADDPRTTPNENNAFDYRDNDTYPWLAWGNRPFVSAAEMLQAPASSSSRLTLDFSVSNPLQPAPPSRYDGIALPQPDRSNGVGDQAHSGDNGAFETNEARLGAFRHPYGHLLNAFQATSASATVFELGEDAIPVGSGNLYRIKDYLGTPSRFVQTEVLMDAALFSQPGPDRLAQPAALNTDDVLLGDPRQPFQAPFNRVAKHREPGKVNLNTVVGRADPNEPADVWSPVYDGLMQRVEDSSRINYASAADPDDDLLITAGHLGPAWRDVVVSRRGYTLTPPPANAGAASATKVATYSPDVLSSNFPTRFANPFRSANAGDLAPLPQLVVADVDASVMRSHHVSPGPDGQWGVALVDDRLVSKVAGTPDGNLLVDDATEAGAGDDFLLASPTGALPDSRRATLAQLDPAGQITAPVEPLFAAGVSEPALDAARNAGIAYGPMTRLENLTTTRSGCFAVWITVGFFEVTPAPTFETVRARFGDPLGGDPVVTARARDLYNRVYPDGYQLGRELNIDTGDTRRFKAFYIIDRTRPVAFKPGEDVNSEAAILVRRRIE